MYMFLFWLCDYGRCPLYENSDFVLGQALCFGSQ